LRFEGGRVATGKMLEVGCLTLLFCFVESTLFISFIWIVRVDIGGHTLFLRWIIGTFLLGHFVQVRSSRSRIEDLQNSRLKT